MKAAGFHFISETQARRYRILLEAIETGASQRATAKRMGITRSAVVAFLWREIDFGGWPPNRAAIEARLALPILPDAEAARQRSIITQSVRLPDGTYENRNSLRRERQALKEVLPPAHAGPSISDIEIHRRREEARRAREAHEAHHLAEERRCHGVTKQTRVGPLSGMKA